VRLSVPNRRRQFRPHVKIGFSHQAGLGRVRLFRLVSFEELGKKPQDARVIEKRVGGPGPRRRAGESR